MVSPRLKGTLDKYHVGDKLRQLRLRRKMGLVEVGTDQTLLESGDSLYFDSLLPHGYSRVGTTPCSALVATSE